MVLYLVRHGEAMSAAEDPKQGLSAHGRKEAERVASYLSSLEVSRIFHSTKLRAAQTAEVFTEFIEPAEGPTEADSLAPMDDPAIWADRLDAIAEDIMLVGHLPFMSRIASLLLTGDPDRAAFEFGPASVLCLKRHEGNRWSVQWMLGPEMVRR
jgi:phosphohistidine phosphatase